MPSIEAAFIGLARYIRDHFPHLTWMPEWYGGIPFPDSYPPLLHATAAAVSAVAHVSAGLAYHAVTASFYSLGPVAFYWAVWRMGGARWPALMAAAGYSLISPTLVWVPAMRRDIGSVLAPCRLDAMVRWGEGPHITSLMFLPLAIGGMYAAIASRVSGLRHLGPIVRQGPGRGRVLFFAAVALAATALTNWLGAFSLALAGGAFLLANFEAAWLPLGVAACWAYAMAAPFFTPSTVETIQANAPRVGGGYVANHALEAAFALGALALAWALAQWKFEWRIRFAALFFYFTAAIPLLAYYFKLEVVPQPQRYHLEMDLAFWMLAGLIAARIGPVALPRPRMALAIAAMICLPVALVQHRRAQALERPIDITSTAEYQVAAWLGGHEPGLRVFAPGTISFWMQAFSDTPMLNGGFDNGLRNLFLPAVIYQIYAGDRLDTAVKLLKAFGVGAVVGGGPKSREFYHPYAHPEKFDGLAELWRNSTEVIYAVPRRRASLAHAMLPSDLPREQPPAYDVKSLDHYLAALDDPALPDASFTWRGADAAEIKGNFTPGQILSVQVTFDKGWHATVGGEPRPVAEDKLGQMAIEPRCSGACTVELDYDGGVEEQGARWLSLAGLLAGIAVIVMERVKK